MPRKTLVFIAVLILAAAALPALAQGMSQETPPSLVASYSDLANIILAARSMEENVVRTILADHYHGAEAYFKQGNFDASAAQMALFANEGDNAVGGVRKRLLEGGHHHNAEGERQGTFEPGFVIVDRKAKKALLDASAALRQATTDAARQQAWKDFAAVAEPLLHAKTMM